jgi:hypothetical protein
MEDVFHDPSIDAINDREARIKSLLDRISYWNDTWRKLNDWVETMNIDGIFNPVLGMMKELMVDDDEPGKEQ